MIYETKRLYTRPLTETDLPSLSAILQDEKTMYAYEGAFSDEQVREWYDRQQERYRRNGIGLWAVISKETGGMIGECGLTWQAYEDKQLEGSGFGRRLDAAIPEIGYQFRRDYWHHGYATEAAVGCRDFAFKSYGFPAVYSIIRDTNFASMNVAIRMGMIVIDRFTKYYRGVEMPHYVFRVLNHREKRIDELEMLKG